MVYSEYVAMHRSIAKIRCFLNIETAGCQNLLPSNAPKYTVEWKHRKPRRLLSLTPLFSTDYKAYLRSKTWLTSHQCSLFIPNIYDRWSLIHLYILAPSTSVQSSVQPASCRPFYFTTGPYHHLQFHHSLPKQEQSLEFNRAGRKDVAKFCKCAGGEYLQCICVCVCLCVCLKNFHGIIFSFISKGYPTKIMILYLNLWVIKNIIFVKFNQMCVEIQWRNFAWGCPWARDG